MRKLIVVRRSSSTPVLQYPSKIVNLDLDKNPNVEGRLLGIKGQYLILDMGNTGISDTGIRDMAVICVRKFGGYVVEFKGGE